MTGGTGQPDRTAAAPESGAALNGPHGVLLAAGASRRFGSIKALARFESRSLIELAVERARSVVGNQLTVVLGAHADAILATGVLADITVLRHESWGNGLAESLRHGLLAVPPSAPAALIMLVDQPLVTTTDLRSLIDTWLQDPTRAAAAEYAGDVGAPCILPRQSFAQLLELRGDRGAKALLRDMPGLARVPMPNATLDVDTPADLDSLRRG